MLKGCRLWLTVAVLAAAIAVVLATTRGRGELAVYTKAASRLLAGEEIYRTSDYKQFSYPPFFALPAVLLLALPESLQAPAWYFVSLLAMAAGVPIVLWRIWPTLRVTGEGVGPSRMVFLWLLSLLSWVHLTASIEYGSHDLLLFSCWRLGRAPGPQRRRGGPGSFSASGRRPKRLLCSSSPFSWAGASSALLEPSQPPRRPPRSLWTSCSPRRDGSLWVAVWYRTFHPARFSPHAVTPDRLISSTLPRSRPGQRPRAVGLAHPLPVSK